MPRGAFQARVCLGALTATEPAERRRQAEAWCDRFEANNAKWLKTTVAQWTGDDVELSYEDVDTSLITPRPRLYGLVGADEIEKVWKERQAGRQSVASTDGNGSRTAGKVPAVAGH
jgi:succinate dehydrogenase / fumarate reductase, flavoprotein subunit